MAQELMLFDQMLEKKEEQSSFVCYRCHFFSKG